MQRSIGETVFKTDKGRLLITLKPQQGQAIVDCSFVTPDELDELADACRAAKEELRSMAAMDAVH